MMSIELKKILFGDFHYLSFLTKVKKSYKNSKKMAAKWQQSATLYATFHHYSAQINNNNQQLTDLTHFELGLIISWSLVQTQQGPPDFTC
ncbi:hypothetical protein [Pantoea sp. SGAir0183]